MFDQSQGTYASLRTIELEEEYVLERLKVSEEYQKFSEDFNDFETKDDLWDISVIDSPENDITKRQSTAGFNRFGRANVVFDQPKMQDRQQQDSENTGLLLPNIFGNFHIQRMPTEAQANDASKRFVPEPLTIEVPESNNSIESQNLKSVNDQHSNKSRFAFWR